MEFTSKPFPQVKLMSNVYQVICWAFMYLKSLGTMGDRCILKSVDKTNISYMSGRINLFERFTLSGRERLLYYLRKISKRK